jgi:hypothetical protein
MVYHQLKYILHVAIKQQGESSLQQWVEVSILSPGRSKASRQRNTLELPAAETTSSPMRAPTCLWHGHPSRGLEPLTHCQAHRGEEGVHFEHHMRNPCRGRHGDRERCSLSPEGLGPKAFGSNTHGACFPKRFRVPNNVIKYDGKTNPIICIEDYCLACRAGEVDDDLFTIDFLPIYLADTSRASLDHLPQNSIDYLEDIKETFTSNFQGTYKRLGNPWNLTGCRQKQRESLQDYIRELSRKCHELPKICDTDIISAFWYRMNCRTPVQELIRDQPKTMKELPDITTRHTSSEEAVGAIFV